VFAFAVNHGSAHACWAVFEQLTNRQNQRVIDARCAFWRASGGPWRLHSGRREFKWNVFFGHGRCFLGLIMIMKYNYNQVPEQQIC
jgi:hypothetical protein